MTTLIEELQVWARAHRVELARRDIELAYTDSPRSGEAMSAWLDVDSHTRFVRVVLRSSGEVTLSVGEVSTGDVIHDEHIEVTTPFGLIQVLGSAIAWAEGLPDH